MNSKIVLFALFALFAYTSAGVVPVAPYVAAPYATSYNAHAVNHAVATPLAAPLVSAPLAAAYPYAAAYSAYPYSAAYSAPIVAY